MQASHLPWSVRWLDGPSVTLSDFHCVGISGPSQSVQGPRNLIFSKSYDQQVSNSFVKLKVEWSNLGRKLVWIKGCIPIPKRMNFWKSYKWSLIPHPHFWKIMLQIFPKFMTEVPLYNDKNLQHNFLDWK